MSQNRTMPVDEKATVLPPNAASSPFAKLSDLTSFHLQNSAGTGSSSSIPAMSFAARSRVLVPGGLNIPRLNLSRAGFSTPSASASVVPDASAVQPRPRQLSTAVADATAPTSALTPRSLRQIMELKKLQLTELTPPPPPPPTTESESAANDARVPSTIIVNLSAAAANPLKIAPSRPADNCYSGIGEHPPKIPPICHPCDVAANPAVGGSALLALAENLTHECLIDCSALVLAPDPQLVAIVGRLKTPQCSRIARVLCTRYATRGRDDRLAGRVRHEFAHCRNRMRPYAFDKPSPDDLIQRQLAKWKKI